MPVKTCKSLRILFVPKNRDKFAFILRGGGVKDYCYCRFFITFLHC